MELKHISILKELLKRQIHPIKNDILQTLNKGIIKRIGHALEIPNIRIYLFNTSGRKIIQKQVLGDSAIWKVIRIEEAKADIALYDKFYLIKIKYSNDNGRLVPIGYLGVYKGDYISDQELGLLEILCMIYGDYIRKRISLTIDLKIRDQLSNIYGIAFSGERAGTIITKYQNIFHRSLNAYVSYYATISEQYIQFEYVKNQNNVGPIVIKNNTNIFAQDFIEKCSEKNFILSGDDPILENIRKYFKKYPTPIKPDCIYYIYAIFDKGQLLGCWMLIFTDNQYFDSSEAHSFINFASPLIINSCKHIFQRRTKKMVLDPIFKSRDTRVDSNKVFILMPFTLEWSNRIWQQMIKPTVEKNNLNPIRADDLYGHDIMEDIWQGILSAKIVIADITGRNPNVFYELGIAHTLGKEVILITQNKDDIPFDLNRYRHIIYQDNYDGYELLKSKLGGAIADILKNA